VSHVDIHIKYSNHIPAVVQGPQISQSVLSIFGKAYRMIALIFLACLLSNMVLKNMTFLCFYVCISFYCAPLSCSNLILLVSRGQLFVQLTALLSCHHCLLYLLCCHTWRINWLIDWLIDWLRNCITNSWKLANHFSSLSFVSNTTKLFDGHRLTQ